MNKMIQKIGFVFRMRYYSKSTVFFRKLWLRALGMKIGKGSLISKIHITWPNQVVIGDKCKIERNVYFKFVGIWKADPSILIGDGVFIGDGCEFNIQNRITIGDDSLIASGCKFIDHDHGTALGSLMRFQTPVEGEITIGKGVWLGYNVIVLKGVKIGNGAIVAAGAVVTKQILPNEIWGGVPARKIGDRS